MVVEGSVGRVNGGLLHPVSTSLSPCSSVCPCSRVLHIKSLHFSLAVFIVTGWVSADSKKDGKYFVRLQEDVTPHKIETGLLTTKSCLGTISSSLDPYSRVHAALLLLTAMCCTKLDCCKPADH